MAVASFFGSGAYVLQGVKVGLISDALESGHAVFKEELYPGMVPGLEHGTPEIKKFLGQGELQLSDRLFTEDKIGTEDFFCLLD